MLNKLNIKGIWLSSIIGLIIGSLNLVFIYKPANTNDLIIVLIACTLIGLFIGAITEVITALLPISLANPKRYFFINNLIALITTCIILVIIFAITSAATYRLIDLLTIIGIAITVVIVSNGMDYLYYVRTNKKLRDYQSRKTV